MPKSDEISLIATKTTYIDCYGNVKQVDVQNQNPSLKFNDFHANEPKRLVKLKIFQALNGKL